MTCTQCVVLFGDGMVERPEALFGEGMVGRQEALEELAQRGLIAFGGEEGERVGGMGAGRPLCMGATPTAAACHKQHAAHSHAFTAQPADHTHKAHGVTCALMEAL